MPCFVLSAHILEMYNFFLACYYQFYEEGHAMILSESTQYKWHEPLSLRTAIGVYKI